MKVTFNWLKQYVEFPWPPEALAERLTMLGLEVESVEKVRGEFEGIVVAQVLTKDKHPNADKLTLCRVNDGQGERQIVCGAQNFQAGDKVPLILPGYALPAKVGEEPFVIKVGKIRGVESHGMMCSPKELGLAEDASGLLILPPDAQVGQPFAEFLGRAGGDVVLDLEITPNRPDLNSVIGIAREISAVTGHPLKLPDVGVPAPAGGEGASVTDLVAVRLDDAELCPRYTARVVRGVKVGPSPDWLRAWLEKTGLRSINNVVDATNFVMWETGQPLHAFDYHLIARGEDGKPTIVVRRARPGEKFTTLDGQERALTDQMLLIADPHKAIALAGVMGGLNSEINPQTVDVLIESAYFKPANIRLTAKALGLRTDASYRFERGADIGLSDWASLRCAQILLQIAGGQLAQGVVDAYPQPFTPRHITLRHAKVNELLGLELPPETIEYYLGQLGLKIVGRKPRPVGIEAALEPAVFRIPSFRVDLKRETDLIEEVARLHGVDKIPATTPRGALGANAFDAVFDHLGEARRILTGLGLDEAQGQTLISATAAQLALPALATASPIASAVRPGVTPAAPMAQTPPVETAAQLVRLANPLSADMNVLRPSLLPGLLEALRHNVSHRNNDAALFELGRVFAWRQGQIQEEWRVALALTGQRHRPFWTGEERAAKYDLYDLKGLVEEFLDQFGLRGVVYLKRDASTPLFLESAAIALGGKIALGELGQLLPPLARSYDLRDSVFAAELHLGLLLAKRNPHQLFRALPQHPSIRRDVAMIVAETVSHEAVLQAVRQAKPQHLENVELFDVFRGKHVPAGQKSLAYAFTYRHADRTLTDAEVNAAHEKLVAHLKPALSATVRES